MLKRVAIILILALSSLMLISCGNQTASFVLFSCDCTIKLEGGQSDVAMAEIKTTLAEIDEQVNVFKSGSDLYKLNNSAVGEDVIIGTHTAYLLELATQLYDETDGAFNPAMRALSKLWAFSYEDNGGAEHRVPSDAKINELLPYASLSYIVYDKENKTVTRTSDKTELDFGGIAKGYACDLAFEICKKYDVEKAVINIGGNIYVLGTATIGISAIDGGDYFATVSVTNASIQTSGDYERYFEIDGVRYCHILGKDGKSINSGLGAVTLLGANSAYLDGLATAIMVDGASGTKYLENKDIAYIIINKNKGYVTDKLTNLTVIDSRYLPNG